MVMLFNTKAFMQLSQNTLPPPSEVMTSFIDDLLEQKTIEKSRTFDTSSFGILLLWNLECRERRLAFYLFSIPTNFFSE